LIQEMSEEDKETYLNEDNTEFDMSKVEEGLNEALNAIESEELDALNNYIALLDRKAKKQEKIAFITANPAADWTAIEPSKDGTYSKKNVLQRMDDIRLGYPFPEYSIEWVLLQVIAKTEQVKILKKEISAREKDLHEQTKTTIENLTDAQVLMLLHEKWVRPLHENLLYIPQTIIDDLTAKVTKLAAKYETGLMEVEHNIVDAGRELSAMLDELTGAEFDMQACNELKNTLSTGVSDVMKAALLEKMFPKEGETIPQVRFKGFEEEWETKQIVEIFGKEADKGYPELPVLSASQELGMIKRDNIGINMQYSRQNIASYKRVLPGRFVIHLRSFQGGFAHSAIEGITSPAYTILCLRDLQKHDDYYWKYVFTSPMFIKRLELVTYGIRDGRSISVDDFFELLFTYPSKDEQHKIASFFSCLDTLISAHEQKLDKLRSLKKSFLEKMFVNIQN